MNPIRFSGRSWEIVGAHKDDVHALVLLDREEEGKRSFVSAGKDGGLYRWSSKTGALEATLRKTTRIDYEKWTTALCSQGNILVEGRRDGLMQIWDLKSCQVKAECEFKSKEHPSKERNQNRITCVTLEGESLWTGIACQLMRGRFTNKRYQQLSQTLISDKDWVYCVNSFPSHPERLAVVTGCNMSIWSKPKDERLSLKKEKMIVKKDHEEVAVQRHPHISSIAFIENDRIAYTCFTNKDGWGAVRVVDPETGKRIFNGLEHIGRAWTVARQAPFMLVTGADDGFIKMWDVRTRPTTCATSPKHIGRVSQIFTPTPEIVVAASCPDRLEEGAGAVITCWDHRAHQLGDKFQYI